MTAQLFMREYTVQLFTTHPVSDEATKDTVTHLLVALDSFNDIEGIGQAGNNPVEITVQGEHDSKPRKRT